MLNNTRRTRGDGPAKAFCAVYSTGLTQRYWCWRMLVATARNRLLYVLLSTNLKHHNFEISWRRWYIGPDKSPTELSPFPKILWNTQMHVHFELARPDFGDDFGDYYWHDENPMQWSFLKTGLWPGQTQRKDGHHWGVVNCWQKVVRSMPYAYHRAFYHQYERVGFTFDRSWRLMGILQKSPDRPPRFSSKPVWIFGARRSMPFCEFWIFLFNFKTWRTAHFFSFDWY